LKTLANRSLASNVTVSRACALIRDRWDEETHDHRRLGPNPVTFQCDDCGKRFMLIRSGDGGQRTGHCPICGVECQPKETAVTSRQCCPKCQREFRNPVALKMHLRDAH